MTRQENALCYFSSQHTGHKGKEKLPFSAVNLGVACFFFSISSPVSLSLSLSLSLSFSLSPPLSLSISLSVTDCLPIFVSVFLTDTRGAGR